MTTMKFTTGELLSVEAREMLLNMVENKINSLRIRNLSSQVGFNKPDEECQARITELQEAREQIVLLLQIADGNGRAEIEANIRVATGDFIAAGELV